MILVWCSSLEEHFLFPFVSSVQEFNKTWDQKCHGEKYKVDPSSLCSVIQYLSEVRLRLEREKSLLRKVQYKFFFYRVKSRVKVKKKQKTKNHQDFEFASVGRFQAKRKRTYARDNENLSVLYHGILCPSFLIPLLSYETLESCRRPSQLIRTKRPSVSTWGSAFRLVVLKYTRILVTVFH